MVNGKKDISLNLDKFNSFIANIDKLDSSSSSVLNELISQYPYFQTARVLHLKSLHNQKNINFDEQLKLTATYLNDRKILFRLINDPTFIRNFIDQPAEDVVDELKVEEVVERTPETTKQEIFEITDEIITPQIEIFKEEPFEIVEEKEDVIISDVLTENIPEIDTKTEDLLAREEKELKDENVNIESNEVIISNVEVEKLEEEVEEPIVIEHKEEDKHLEIIPTIEPEIKVEEVIEPVHEIEEIKAIKEEIPVIEKESKEEKTIVPGIESEKPVKRTLADEILSKVKEIKQSREKEGIEVDKKESIADIILKKKAERDSGLAKIDKYKEEKVDEKIEEIPQIEVELKPEEEISVEPLLEKPEEIVEKEDIVAEIELETKSEDKEDIINEETEDNKEPDLIEINLETEETATTREQEVEEEIKAEEPKEKKKLVIFSDKPLVRKKKEDLLNFEFEKSLIGKTDDVFELNQEEEFIYETYSINNYFELENDTESKNIAVSDETQLSDANLSFEEWLDKFNLVPKQNIEKPIIKENNKESQLIDRFIQSDPSIKPLKEDFEYSFKIEDSEEDHEDEFITETLAGIYIKQKHYEKAINAYKKLSLKYPEKNIYFANQIKKVKELIKNK